ncbi:hypothetical protein CKA32_002005 [Geitlerinema sp. FC II]|nr:hypothetical protein CKA32_002005 [Geitlerinema sp. FC II]
MFRFCQTTDLGLLHLKVIFFGSSEFRVTEKLTSRDFKGFDSLIPGFL